MAIGALRELKSAGLRVPQDVSVIGFDDITFAALAEPQLTTIMLPRAGAREAAVEALMHDRGRGQPRPRVPGEHPARRPRVDGGGGWESSRGTRGKGATGGKP